MEEAERDRIILEIHGSVKALDERTIALPELLTKTVPELGSRITKNETEVKWLKRIVFQLLPVLGTAGGAGAVLLKLIGI